jgi:hypothetical protein
MSRAYRIRVRESLRRFINAEDHVSTQLELLELLPAEQMAELLADELLRAGFERRGKKMVRQQKELVIEIDPESAHVTVRAETAAEIDIQGERQAVLDRQGNRQTNKKAEEAARQELREDLAKKAAGKQEALVGEASKKLQEGLADVRRELDQIVNRVTAEALKKKAAQIGQVREVSEDRANGSLTIVLEV